MSSPITFSGFNNIDFNLVVTSLMQQASAPLTSLQSRQKNLQSQVGSLDKLATHVSTIRSAAAALGNPANLTMLSGTSSDSTSVGISVGTAALAGQLDIVVNELAKAQITVSNSSAPDANTTIVANAGTLTIGGVAVTVAGDSTLQQLADAINNTAGIGVSASVIRTSPTTYRLALSGTSAGVANAFTITNALSGGTGVTFTDTDFNGVSGDSAADNAVSATDASLLVNNIPVTGTSNVFDEIMPGVTITALKKDPTATIQLGIATDGTALKEKIDTFITAYNELTAFIGEQRTAAATGDGASIGREPTLRQLHNALRAALSGAHGTGVLTRLAEAGIEFTSKGQLKLNETVFNQAVTSGSADVRELFGGTAGVFVEMPLMLDPYSQVDGIIPGSKKRLEAQIATMDAQIEAMQRRLAIQKESLQRQFAEADLIMSRLKAQSSSLASFGGGLGSI